jgi:hypothetical protein
MGAVVFGIVYGALCGFVLYDSQAQQSRDRGLGTAWFAIFGFIISLPLGPVLGLALLACWRLLRGRWLTVAFALVGGIVVAICSPLVFAGLFGRPSEHATLSWSGVSVIVLLCAPGGVAYALLVRFIAPVLSSWWNQPGTNLRKIEVDTETQPPQLTAPLSARRSVATGALTGAIAGAMLLAIVCLHSDPHLGALIGLLEGAILGAFIGFRGRPSRDAIPALAGAVLGAMVGSAANNMFISLLSGSAAAHVFRLPVIVGGSTLAGAIGVVVVFEKFRR